MTTGVVSRDGAGPEAMSRPLLRGRHLLFSHDIQKVVAGDRMVGLMSPLRVVLTMVPEFQCRSLPLTASFSFRISTSMGRPLTWRSESDWEAVLKASTAALSHTVLVVELAMEIGMVLAGGGGVGVGSKPDTGPRSTKMFTNIPPATTNINTAAMIAVKGFMVFNLH
jgi:hypothetical protein